MGGDLLLRAHLTGMGSTQDENRQWISVGFTIDQVHPHLDQAAAWEARTIALNSERSAKPASHWARWQRGYRCQQ